MIYILAAVLFCAIVFVVWRIVGPNTPGGGRTDGGPRRPAPRGPDDDPDFLRSLKR